jgi:predicted deacylase
MRLPTLPDLRETFETLRASETDGVPGVLRIAGAPGPTMILTCLTHGHEACGLAPLWYLLQQEDLQKHLRGTLLLCVNNPEPASAYFAEGPDGDPRVHRYRDIDMNRLPRNAEDLASGDTAELRRLRALLPVYAQADIGVDFHGFPYPGDSMTIDVKGDDADVERLSDAMPVLLHATNMVEVQDGFPVGQWYGGFARSIPVIEVECGMNEDPVAFAVGIRCGLSALISTGMLDLPHTLVPMPQDIYRLRSSIKVPDRSYVLPRTFAALERLPAGTVIAEGDGEPIVVQEERYSLFARHDLTVTAAQYEILWLTDPPVRRMRRCIAVPD